MRFWQSLKKFAKPKIGKLTVRQIDLALRRLRRAGLVSWDDYTRGSLHATFTVHRVAL